LQKRKERRWSTPTFR